MDRAPISSGCSGRCSCFGAAEDITGLARGIAYQLVEALGVLERSKVADDLKSLDQASRAVLRKHGVRFGAYHVYVPLQLKPAPRALAAQLWALKHGGPELKGLDELQRLAASGRTSFAADKEVPAHALSHHRLPGLRRARGAGRYSRAACRSHPAGAGLAARFERRRSRAARSTAAASR